MPELVTPPDDLTLAMRMMPSVDYINSFHSHALDALEETDRLQAEIVALRERAEFLRTIL